MICNILGCNGEAYAKRALPKDFDASDQESQKDSNNQAMPKGESMVGEKEDPMKILKIGFAKGEISKEEFEEMKKMLEQNQ